MINRKIFCKSGPWISACAPSHESKAHQMLMRLNIRCHSCLSFSQSVLVFYLRSDIVKQEKFRLPLLCIFTNLEVRKRYLPIIRGAGTPFPCYRGSLTTGNRRCRCCPLAGAQGCIRQPQRLERPLRNGLTMGVIVPCRPTRVHVPAKVNKGKRSPYSITERRVPELIPVLSSQPAGDVSQ